MGVRGGKDLVSIQRFYIYAEQGLSRQRVAVWIYEGQLRIEYRETLLARYRCADDQRQKRLREVSQPTLDTTVFASPQLELLELDATRWIKVQQRVLHWALNGCVHGGAPCWWGWGPQVLFSFMSRPWERWEKCFPHVPVVM